MTPPVTVCSVKTGWEISQSKQLFPVTHWLFLAVRAVAWYQRKVKQKPKLRLTQLERLTEGEDTASVTKM